MQIARFSLEVGGIVSFYRGPYLLAELEGPFLLANLDRGTNSGGKGVVQIPYTGMVPELTGMSVPE